MAERGAPSRRGLLLATTLVGVVCWRGPATAQVAASDSVHEERIAEVVASLPAPVQLEGHEPRRAPLEERMRHHAVPGVSVAVLDDGEIVWARAWGVVDTESGEPVSPETLFQAASISKPVAAMAALRLVDEGILELDTDVNRYLVGWTIPHNEWTALRPVTLRRILTHTGGLTQHGFPGYRRGGELPTVPQILDATGPANTDAVRVDTLPGARWSYSGGGYTILQQLLEDVTGRPFAELLRETVLEPAGMRHSTYRQPLPRNRWDEAAHAHDSEGRPYPGDWHVYPEQAAAGLWTTPSDLLSLVREVQRSYRGESNRILSRETTRKMLEPGMNDWGLGFTTGDGSLARFGHGGSNAGFRALLTAYVHQGRGVAVMTNGDGGGPLSREILFAVAREYGWEGEGVHPRTHAVARIPAEERREFAGTYELVGIPGSFTLEVEGEGLAAELFGERAVLLPDAEGGWFRLEDGTDLRFERDENGRIEGLRIGPTVRARKIH